MCVSQELQVQHLLSLDVGLYYLLMNTTSATLFQKIKLCGRYIVIVRQFIVLGSDYKTIHCLNTICMKS